MTRKPDSDKEAMNEYSQGIIELDLEGLAGDMREIMGREEVFPSDSDDENPPPARRPGFSPWVGKIPWRKEWPSTPVFLPGEFYRQTTGSERVGHD